MVTMLHQTFERMETTFQTLFKKLTARRRRDCHTFNTRLHTQGQCRDSDSCQVKCSTKDHYPTTSIEALHRIR